MAGEENEAAMVNKEMRFMTHPLVNFPTILGR
jgi:hypothetical protein